MKKFCSIPGADTGDAENNINAGKDVDERQCDIVERGACWDLIETERKGGEGHGALHLIVPIVNVAIHAPTCGTRLTTRRDVV